MATKKKPAKKKPAKKTLKRAPRKQTEIPGAEAPHDAKLSGYADSIYQLKIERDAITEKERDLRRKACERMRALCLDKYIDEELELEITYMEIDPPVDTEKVSVKKWKGSKAGVRDLD